MSIKYCLRTQKYSTKVQYCELCHSESQEIKSTLLATSCSLKVVFLAVNRENHKLCLCQCLFNDFQAEAPFGNLSCQTPRHCFFEPKSIIQTVVNVYGLFCFSFQVKTWREAQKKKKKDRFSYMSNVGKMSKRAINYCYAYRELPLK